MRKRLWTAARIVLPVATLAILVWRLGTGPFVDGVRTVDAWALSAAVGIAALTTLCCAWRWRVVSRGLGVDLSLPGAVAAYYRSIFLNVTLPGGVVGDVHRGVSHGRDAGDVGRGLRAVGWERTAGQVVQAVVTVVVLLALPSPVRAATPYVAIGVAVVAIVVVLLVRARPGSGGSRWARARRVVSGDMRDGVLARGVWPVVVLASAVAVAGHALTFLIAARTAGVDEPVSRMLPLALLVLLAGVLPSIAGWGPREGITAWAFGAAGLGADRGVACAVAFGVLLFAASLPGAAVLVVAWLRRHRRPRLDGTAHA